MLFRSHQGTLFLDEVEGMSPALQVKLLRVLQEREIMRVGGTSIIPIDVRIVAATNESLERKVAEGTFRRDLYYRLSTLPIVIPPLSERGDDLFLILEQFQKELGGSFRLTPQVRGFLKSYSWPGNIRELENVLENAVALSESELIYAEHIHLEGTAPAPLTLKERLKREERQILRQTLAQCGGSRVKAMELLGLSKTVFYGKLKEYQLD